MSAKRSLPFLWGAAISSHQVEGNNFFNDWWAFEEAGKVKEKSGLACDQYHRFDQDFQIVQQLGQPAHRLSLEWSRFEPEENVWNEEAFKHYEEVFKSLKARNIEPVVTLHHFTNPQWFAEKAAFLNEDAVDYFSRYVEKVVKVFGPYVRYWITINEPLVYIYHGYLTGLWPPGQKNAIRASWVVYLNLLKAHIEAYKTIHRIYDNNQLGPVWVSIAKHVSHFTPCRPHSLLDRAIVYLRNWYFNFLFVDAAMTGFAFFPGVFSEILNGHHTLDFIGLNYYTRDFIGFVDLKPENLLGVSCDKTHHKHEMGERSSMGWEVYPEGLYHLLKDFGRYKLPILIMENGIATQEDAQRAHFIRSHLASVEKARHHGVPVNGYFYWSLLDNFEWAEGFGPRFGIVEVNYQNQERKIRDSAYVLTECCRKIGGGG